MSCSTGVFLPWEGREASILQEGQLSLLDPHVLVLGSVSGKGRAGTLLELRRTSQASGERQGRWDGKAACSPAACGRWPQVHPAPLRRCSAVTALRRSLPRFARSGAVSHVGPMGRKRPERTAAAALGRGLRGPRCGRGAGGSRGRGQVFMTPAAGPRNCRRTAAAAPRLAAPQPGWGPPRCDHATQGPARPGHGVLGP